MNEYFEEIDKNKYFKLVPTNEGKEKIQKIWRTVELNQIFHRSGTKNSDNYDEKYMKIKFNSYDELPLNKKKEISSMIIVVRFIFLENNKDYLKFVVDEYLYKL